MRWLAFTLFLVVCCVLMIDEAVEISPASTNAPLCSDHPDWIADVKALLQQGLSKAVVTASEKVTRVWLISGFEGRERAAEGIRNEARGYLYARGVIEALNIPPCTPKGTRAPRPEQTR